MQRDANLDAITRRREPLDMLVIGGGATGVGIALDAAARGYAVALLEQDDLGKGTSSRSTKLVHGGVRYLQQGNISLVMEALKERGLMRANAPHLVHDLAFVVPNYDWWEAPFYGVGMKVYDLLAGQYGFGRSRLLDQSEVLERIPTLAQQGLRGGVLYYDGQFDDARLLVDLARTADARGAAIVNYARVTALSQDAGGFVDGVDFEDREGGGCHRVAARVVINATGPWTDEIRRLDDAAAEPMIEPSQGIHLVFDGSFLAGETAIMVPRTSDKRVMFAIPWHGRTVVGTTDTPVSRVPLEPVPLAEEIDFVLETAAPYLRHRPSRTDIRSVFAGIRPLVRAERSTSTATLSRDHTITISRSGLLTVAGGKWTTYRKMAEDAVDHAATLAMLEPRPCPTRELRIHGGDAEGVEALGRDRPALAEPLHEALEVTGAQVVWSARHEMARTVEDALSRRTRALLLDAAAAIEAAPAVAALLAEELGRDDAWQRREVEQFAATARGYLPLTTGGRA
jgi:glycerol-3-phosphate dehydrogenase